MPHAEEIFSIVCNTLTAGVGIAFVGLASFVLQKHYVHGVVTSPVIVEAFIGLSFGCLLITTEIVINSIWCGLSQSSSDWRRTQKWEARLDSEARPSHVAHTTQNEDSLSSTSKKYKYFFITAAVWKMVLLIVELPVGLALFTPNIVRYEVNATMTDAFSAYDPALLSTTERVDLFQHDLECCGLYDYTDWFSKLGGQDVTLGCCKDTADKDCYKSIGGKQFTIVQEKIYTLGCSEAYSDGIANASLIATILFYVAAGLLVLSSISYVINVVKNVVKTEAHADATDHAFVRTQFPDSTEGQSLMSGKPVAGEEMRMFPSN